MRIGLAAPRKLSRLKNSTPIPKSCGCAVREIKEAIGNGKQTA
jgi:hypothetical protein